jgi:hypothetical protein
MQLITEVCTFLRGENAVIAEISYTASKLILQSLSVMVTFKLELAAIKQRGH